MSSKKLDTLFREVSIPSDIGQGIIDFVAEIKQDEDQYLIDVSPRLVVGFQRLVKASSRSELRHKAEKRDLERVKSIVRASLSL